MTRPTPRSREPVLMEFNAHSTETRLTLKVEIDPVGNIIMELPTPMSACSPLQRGMIRAIRALCGTASTGSSAPVPVFRHRP